MDDVTLEHIAAILSADERYGKPRLSPMTTDQKIALARELWSYQNGDDEDASIALVSIDLIWQWYNFLGSSADGKASRLLQTAYEEWTKEGGVVLDRLIDCGVLRARGQGCDIQTLIAKVMKSADKVKENAPDPVAEEDSPRR